MSAEPSFVEPIPNITIPAGRDIKLSCVVDNLGSYKVAWIAFDKSAVLTVQDQVITRNPRVRVTHDGQRTWTLHISRVNSTDAGTYMCQVNTLIAKNQFGVLKVVVPPNIVGSDTSGDATVSENANLTLTCGATGTPPPSITWRREDNLMINIDKKMKVTEHTGPHLYLDRISRMDMAAYLCIARNGVPPSVSKRIQVSVEFSPMMSIPHQLVGAPLGYSITLECTIEAHPPPLTFWTVKEGAMLHHGRKYDITETPGSVPYRIHMKLTVRNLQREDFGPHKCVAKNSKGETEGLIKLYETQPPTLAPTTPRSYLDKLFQAIHYQTTQSADIYDDEDNNLQQEQGEDQAGDQRQEHEGEESEDEEHSEQNHIRMEGSEEQGRGEKRIHDSRSSTSSSPQRGREDTEARGNREHHFTRLLSRGPTVHQASTTLALHCIGLAVILQYCIRHLL